MTRAGIQKHLDIAPLLRCPICGSDLHACTASVACAAGHDFAVSSKGFLTLMARPVALKGYDGHFFESRRRVLDAGYYDAVRDALVEETASFGPGSLVVDAGCGEGTYAKAVSRAHGCDAIGLDLARDGIRCAARGGGRERWLIADLARIPLRDHVADAVLNVFTPANYAEFKRVLKPDGVLIKVVPAERHMVELRQLAAEHLAHAPFDDHGVAEHLARHMRIASRRRITQTSPVCRQDAGDLIRMSPVAFDIAEGQLDLDALASITVDAEVIVARP